MVSSGERCPLSLGKDACQIHVAGYNLVGCDGYIARCDPDRKLIRQTSYGVKSLHELDLTGEDPFRRNGYIPDILALDLKPFETPLNGHSRNGHSTRSWLTSLKKLVTSIASPVRIL